MIPRSEKARERIQPSFRQSDVTRALQGARRAGFDVGRAEIGLDGKIVLVAKGEAWEPQNDLDKWLDKNNARST